jgi:carbon monoxide dehydrogenase subunit G
MLFQNAFEVPLPPECAGLILLDVERIASCVPGARLTGKLDDSTWKGEIDVRLGPVALNFGGTVRSRKSTMPPAPPGSRPRGPMAAVMTAPMPSPHSGSRPVPRAHW